MRERPSAKIPGEHNFRYYAIMIRHNNRTRARMAARVIAELLLITGY